MVSRQRAPRRRWSVAFKKRAVTEASRPAASVAEVARHYNLNANHLLNWKKKYGSEVALVPVEIVSDSDQGLPQGSCYRSKDHGTPSVGRNASNLLEIDLPCGSTVCCGSDVNSVLVIKALTALRAKP